MQTGSKQVAGIGILLALITFLIVGSIYADDQPPLPLPGSSLNTRAATQLLANGGFETDNDGNGIPDNWIGKNTVTSKPDKRKCNKPEKQKFYAHSGNCAFQFTGNSNATGSILQQNIVDTSGMVDGMSMVFSAYLDPRSGVPGTIFGKAQIKYSNNSKQKFNLTIPEVSRSIEDYILVQDGDTINIPDTSSISSIKVKFVYGATSGKFMIDDATLTIVPIDITTPTSTTTPTHTPTFTTTLTQTATTTPSITPTNTPFPDPNKLIAGDGDTNDFFGYSVALSGDGNTALVGAYQDDSESNSNQGSAYVFTRSGDIWTQQTQLTASDGDTNDFFGLSVALSNDGNTALIGAFEDDIEANNQQGSAYIFTRSGDIWTQQAQLTANDGVANDYFGISVALSSDGNIALIGAYRDTIGNNDFQGSAYIFTRNDGVWAEQQKLTASNGVTSNYFGVSVALSDDGDTALVGTRFGENNSKSSVYVFSNNGATWTEQAQLTASDGDANDSFGLSVALSSNGNTALIGAHYHDIGADIDQGAAYIFTRNDTSWTEQVKLTASDGDGGDELGFAVALSSDGNTALVGARYDDIEANEFQGSAYTFTRNGDIWSQQKQLIASDGVAIDQFGWSVALNSTSSISLIGAPENEGHGAAYVFDLTQP